MDRADWGPVRVGIEFPDRSVQWVEVRPYSLLTHDAELVVVDEDGEAVTQSFPDIVTMTGTSEADPATRVAFTVADDQSVQGIVIHVGKTWALSGRLDRANPAASLPLSVVEPTPASERVDAASAEPWCQANDSGAPDDAPLLDRPVDWVESDRTSLGAGYQIILALDTDFEYYARFGSVHDAVRHALDLTLATSLIYEEQIDTRLRLRFLRIWMTAADPWTQPGNHCQLREFGKHFNEQISASTFYTAAMLLSGRLSGGLAWVKQLCRQAFSVSSMAACSGAVAGSGLFGGPYGVMGVDGLPAGTGMTWDVFVFAHELGHIVASPHTHCFAGIQGNPSAIDYCHGSEPGCYAGPTSLPGPPGEQTGTIMSYCHLHNGNESNIAFSLGRNHAWGNQPQRVTNVMTGELAYLQGVAPWCVDNTHDVLTVSVEKSGPVDTRIYTDPANAMPGAPPLDCGDTCVSRRWREWGSFPLAEDTLSPDWMVGAADGCDWVSACGHYPNGMCEAEDPGGNHPHVAVTTHISPAATLVLSSTALQPVAPARVRAEVQPDANLDLRQCAIYQPWIPQGEVRNLKYAPGANVRINAGMVLTPSHGDHFLRWEGACADQFEGPYSGVTAVTCELMLSASTWTRAVFGKAWDVIPTLHHESSVRINGRDPMEWPRRAYEPGSVVEVGVQSPAWHPAIGFDEGTELGSSCVERPSCVFTMPNSSTDVKIRYAHEPPIRVSGNGPIGYEVHSSIRTDAVYVFQLESSGDVAIRAWRAPSEFGSSPVPRELKLLVRKDEPAGIAVADCIADSSLSGPNQVAEAVCSLSDASPGRYYINVRDQTSCEPKDNWCWLPYSSVGLDVDAPSAAPLVRFELMYSGTGPIWVDSLVATLPPVGSGGESWLLRGESPIYRAPAEHEGLQFAGWSGCQSVSGRTCFVGAMEADRQVTVHYASLDDIFANGFD